MYGKDLRSKDYGFSQLKALLASPVMQGEGGIVCENGRYFAAGDKNTRDMLHLIRNTKPRNTKSRPHAKINRKFVGGMFLSLFLSYFLEFLLSIFSFKS